jgi:hypothetical protein
MRLEILCDSRFFTLGCGNIKRFYNQASGLVGIKLSLEGFPDHTPLVIGQEVILPLAIQEGLWLAT